MFTLLLTVTLLVMSSLVAADVTAPRAGQSYSSVQGTFWNGAKFEGSCLLQDFYGLKPPAGLHYVSVATNLNRKAPFCGACVKITPLKSKGRSITAIVMTYCADCPPNALDIPEAPYNILMGSGAGRPGKGLFNWQVVACPYPKDTMPKVQNKTGASKFSFSILIVDATHPIQSVVIRSDTRTFKAYRTDYGYFEIIRDQGPPLNDRVTVTVTCTNGGSFAIKGFEPDAKKAFSASNNC